MVRYCDRPLSVLHVSSTLALNDFSKTAIRILKQFHGNFPWATFYVNCSNRPAPGGGRVVQWCWVNFQCRGVLLIWMIVGQGPTALAVGAGGGWLDIFNLVYHFSFLSSSLWETAQYRLKYCLKGQLSPKQPTNRPAPMNKMAARARKTFNNFSLNSGWILK